MQYSVKVHIFNTFILPDDLKKGENKKMCIIQCLKIIINITCVNFNFF